VWTAVGFVLVVAGSFLVNRRPSRRRSSLEDSAAAGQPVAVEPG
jgi:hypothetical protein